MNILIVYDGIIKDERFEVLKYAMSEEYNHIHRYLPMDMITNRTDNELWGFIFSSPVENIMEYCLMLTATEDDEVHKKVFESYKSIYTKKDIYKDSELLVIGDTLHQLAGNQNVEKIYIYTSFNDKRISDDIFSTYNKLDNVNFCYGNFAKIIEQIPMLGMCIVPHYNHIKVIKEVMDINKSNPPMDILLADYMFNYQSSKDNIPYIAIDGIDVVDYLKDTNINLNLFKPKKEYDYSFMLEDEKE